MISYFYKKSFDRFRALILMITTVILIVSNSAC